MHTSWHSLRFAPLLLIALLAACGQKGPLYRSDGRAEQVTPQESNSTSNRKKSGPAFPAPQSQKEDRVTPPSSTDPLPEIPINDSEPSPPPGNDA